MLTQARRPRLRPYGPPRLARAQNGYKPSPFFHLQSPPPGSSLLSSSLAPWIDKQEKFLKKRIATSPQCILHSAPLQTVARLAQW